MSTPVHDNSVTSYFALALQSKCESVTSISDPVQARDLIQRSIQRVGASIAASLAFIGAECRLVVLPEYVFTGYPVGETFPSWQQKACFHILGKELEEIGKIASLNKIYLAFNAYELDENFPGLYFQTTFILTPEGEVALRYRRLFSLFAPSPHDVWERYLDIYGMEGVFPTVKTEIGTLAAVASEEILYPEIARCLALRGAEILVHPTSEVTPHPRAPKEVARLARAVENSAYVISANTAGVVGTSLPSASADGGSKVVDFRGIVIAEAALGESMSAFGEVDLAALRRHRRRPGMGNLLSRQRPDIFAQAYGEVAGYFPCNLFAAGYGDRNHILQAQRETIKRLSDLGKI